MRLKKYLPEFISNIKEFQELDQVLSTEIDVLKEQLIRLQENQFIETANEEGLKRHEQMLNIVPVKDIEMRRFNILNKYNSTIPFTTAWLTNTLNTTIGRGEFLIDLNYGTYTLTISVVKNKEHLIDNLKRELRKRIPANLVLIINVLSAIEQDVCTGFYLQTGDIITI